MLHDIGMVKCQKEHSWQSGKMILEHRHNLRCEIDQVTPEAIATVAALHDTEHVFDPLNNPLGEVKASIAGLWPGGKIPRELQLLAGILRVADGLDHGSCQRVKDIIVGRDKIKVQADHNPSVEIKHAAEKSALVFALLHHTWQFEHVV
jgi:hypothetical protein